MKKREKDKRIIAAILIALCFLSGCGLNSSSLKELRATVLQSVNSEEAIELADDLNAHKKQVEDDRIVNEDSGLTTGSGTKTASDVETVSDTETEADREMASEDEDEKKSQAAVIAKNDKRFENRFYYGLLSDSMKVVYGEIYDSIMLREEKEVSTLLTENLDIAFQCVLNDFPEIFYVSGYHYTEHTRATKTVRIVFSPNFEMTEEQVKTAQERIDEYVNTCLAGITSQMSEYDKVKYVYDYVINNTEYDLNAPDNQNICSVFIGNKSVCQGYAEATEYLLQKLGFSISIVNGYVENGSRHAWNILLVDDNYYYLDTTWGDVDYQSVEGEETGISKEVMPINYDYFLITTKELENTHQINNTVPLPACVETKNSYYQKEGLYFESVDTEKLSKVFDTARENGQAAVTIKCSDDTVYQAMKNYLLEEQGIFQFTTNKDSVTYYDSSQMRTLCFWLD